MDKTVGFTRLPHSMVEDNWEAMAPWIKKAMDHGVGCKYYSLEGIKQSLIDRTRDAFVAIDGEIIGCVVTQIASYPKRRVLNVLFVGGERLDEWIDNFPVLLEFGRAHGCDGMTGDERMSWIRKLKIKPTYIYSTWDMDL